MIKWKRFTKPRFLFVYPLVVSLFIASQISEHSLRWGLLVVVAGELLRLWANGYIGQLKVNWTQKTRGDRKIGRLMTVGPYAFVRHPLYLGTLLLGAGFCLMVGNLWVTAAALIGFLWSYRKKISEEDAILRDEYPEEFERYRAAVPPLLPTGRRYPRGEGRWGWGGIVASKEWKTALWTAIVAILIYFWEESIQEHEALFEERTSYRLFLLGIVILFVLIDVGVELTRRLRCRPAISR